MGKRLLEIKGLRIYYPTTMGTVKAVDDVSFSVDKGQAVGIAGESGCGKTTLGMSILGLIPFPGRIVSGEVLFNGENLSKKSEKEMGKIRGDKISLVMQAAMNALNPVFRIGDLISEPLQAHHGLTKSEAMKEAKRILGLVGIDPDKVRNYPHELSGGMRQRVIIAMAISLDPDLIILDEPITALDVIIQRQILELISNLRNTMGLSYLLITHDLATMVEVCDQIIVMYAGKIFEETDASTLVREPLHPYTQGLLKSVPRLTGKGEVLSCIPGLCPDLIDPPAGCRFHPRCVYADETCMKVEPELREIEPSHRVACHLTEKFRG